MEALVSVTVSMNLSPNGGGKSHCHLLLTGCEDDEMLKPACARKSIGHWWLICGDEDVRWPHLPALRSCSLPVGRFWLFGGVSRLPQELSLLETFLVFQPLSIWGVGYHVTVLAAHPTSFLLSTDIAISSSCLWCHPF